MRSATRRSNLNMALKSSCQPLCAQSSIIVCNIVCGIQTIHTNDERNICKYCTKQRQNILLSSDSWNTNVHRNTRAEVLKTPKSRKHDFHYFLYLLFQTETFSFHVVRGKLELLNSHIQVKDLFLSLRYGGVCNIWLFLWIFSSTSQ